MMVYSSVTFSTYQLINVYDLAQLRWCSRDHTSKMETLWKISYQKQLVYIESQHGFIDLLISKWITSTTNLLNVQQKSRTVTGKELFIFPATLHW